jgi:hypothetical protein
VCHCARATPCRRIRSSDASLTARGTPRRSRIAKASRTSRIAGEIVMCPRVSRMGPRSVDGTEQENPIRNEGPWRGVEPYSTGAHQRVIVPTQSGTRAERHPTRPPSRLWKQHPSDSDPEVGFPWGFLLVFFKAELAARAVANHRLERGGNLRHAILILLLSAAALRIASVFRHWAEALPSPPVP